jgi:hypothetical protein
MSNNAPVCNIDAPTPVGSGITSKLVSIPVANGVNNTTVINALRQAIQNIYNNQQSQNNRNSSGGGGGQSALGKFVQTSIQTKVVRVYNPDDNTQWVDVKQVTSVTWQNSTTGQSITYVQPPGGS